MGPRRKCRYLFGTHKEAMAQAERDPESVYMFDSDLACEIGVVEAIIYSSIKRIAAPIPRGHFRGLDKHNSSRRFFTGKKFKKLEELGMIEKIPVNLEEIVKTIKSKNFEGLGIGDKVCEWCRIKTLVLHEHHYPKRKIHGGENTHKICPNCHAEYHLMEGMISYRVTENSGRLCGNQLTETESAADNPSRCGVNG